jgi:solute:Na+ symporter, SSS family
LFLQSNWSMPVVNILRGIDPKLNAAPLDANDPHGFAWLMIITTAFTTVCWLTVTFLTSPEPEEKLRSFYQKVQPARLGWEPIAAKESLHSKQSLGWAAADWIAGCGLIYCSLFSVGHLLFGRYLQAGGLFAVGIVCAWFIYWDLSRRGWETLSQ